MPKNKHTAERTVGCVSTPATPLRAPSAPAAWIVIVVVVANAMLTALGVSQAAALAGFASAGALGLRLAARLVQVDGGGRRA